MKTLILAATAALTLASVASANEWKQTAYVEDHYTTQNQNSVTYERVCRDVQVSTGGTAGSGALGGMIIGGLIGKGVTGTDKGAAAGAVLGGVIGADKGTTGGTRTETRCENVAVQTSVPQTYYTHSTVRFYHNGKWQTLRFQK